MGLLLGVVVVADAAADDDAVEPGGSLAVGSATSEDKDDWRSFSPSFRSSPIMHRRRLVDGSLLSLTTIVLIDWSIVLLVNLVDWE